MIRCVPSDEPQLFLTFDDGPHPADTPRVLDLLEKHGAKATFFLVADRVRKHTGVARDIVARGHTIGSHSLDHKYRNFFRGQKRLREWIRRANESLKQDLQVDPIGFRSPAGVVTPPLRRALRDLDIPLIHWDIRFFDRGRALTLERAHKKLQRCRPGSIVLLHDAQRAAFREVFFDTLDEILRGFRDQKISLLGLQGFIERSPK